MAVPVRHELRLVIRAVAELHPDHADGAGDVTVADEQGARPVGSNELDVGQQAAQYVERGQGDAVGRGARPRRHFFADGDGSGGVVGGGGAGDETDDETEHVRDSD